MRPSCRQRNGCTLLDHANSHHTKGRNAPRAAHKQRLSNATQTLAVTGRWKPQRETLHGNQPPSESLHAWKPGAQQSGHRTPIPSASLPDISGTFNSLFKVLFTFPSRYFCAISLECGFSFGWNLPPPWRSNSKERDSSRKRCATTTPVPDGIVTLRNALFQGTYTDQGPGALSTQHNSDPSGCNSHIELFLVQSPLLKES